MDNAAERRHWYEYTSRASSHCDGLVQRTPVTSSGVQVATVVVLSAGLNHVAATSPPRWDVWDAGGMNATSVLLGRKKTSCPSRVLDATIVARGFTRPGASAVSKSTAGSNDVQSVTKCSNAHRRYPICEADSKCRCFSQKSQLGEVRFHMYNRVP